MRYSLANVIAAAAFFGAVTAHAQTQTVSFEGTLTSVPGETLRSVFSFGQGFSGSFTFEPNAPTVFGNFAEYRGSITSFSAVINGLTFGGGAGGSLVTTNRSPGSGADVLDVGTSFLSPLPPMSGPMVGSLLPIWWRIVLADTTGTALSDPTLPSVIPNMSGVGGWTGGEFQLAMVGPSHIGGAMLGRISSVSVTVTSPIPEPETYAMLLAGLGLLGFEARRRKQLQRAAV